MVDYISQVKPLEDAGMTDAEIAALGPDVPASVTFSELRQLVEGARVIAAARAHPVDKDADARELEPLRGLFTKSVVLKVELPAGSVLDGTHLTVKKPGSGIPAARLGKVVGRRLRQATAADTILTEEHLEP